MEPKVKIEIMRSQWKIGGKHYTALAIDDKRHGPDAGPWTTTETFNVPVADLKRAIERAETAQVRR